ncbi:hypothetical protein H6P81_016422 [Aristolochia fimbriata]|uniref:Uncharacterized protein n=1 Tax=Aristolochia fimbriata TaxID=158543 RepID=A0AAV7EBG8_ARIFI|nr:hypothetical protein H6P81_016422 [Aristolochia fimbriata]
MGVTSDSRGTNLSPEKLSYYLFVTKLHTFWRLYKIWWIQNGSASKRHRQEAAISTDSEDVSGQEVQVGLSQILMSLLCRCKSHKEGKSPQ